MWELSMNILDIAQNSISAGAGNIEIEVIEDEIDDLLSISILDDGCGMSDEQVKKVTDPFYTTRTTRKVGLGVPFFKMAAEMAGGRFSIKSQEGEGTAVSAVFIRSHIDRMPLGGMAETISQIICLNEGINIKYTFRFNGKVFSISSAELTALLEGVPLNTPGVMVFLREYIDKNMLNITNV